MVFQVQLVSDYGTETGLQMHARGNLHNSMAVLRHWRMSLKASPMPVTSPATQNEWGGCCRSAAPLNKFDCCGGMHCHVLIL